MKTTVNNAQVAFMKAITEGRLSTDRADKNYVGNYMYMYTECIENGKDMFKHIDTRQYDV